MSPPPQTSHIEYVPVTWYRPFTEATGKIYISFDPEFSHLKNEHKGIKWVQYVI